MWKSKDKVRRLIEGTALLPLRSIGHKRQNARRLRDAGALLSNNSRDLVSAAALELANAEILRQKKGATWDLGLNHPDLSGANQGRLLPSLLCQQEHFFTPGYDAWIRRLGESSRFHRKQWEFYFIAQALYERDCLQSGKRGIGFGVGNEPLVSSFAHMGAKVVATDLHSEAPQSKEWRSTNEHADDGAALNKLGLCDAKEFTERVHYQAADMNDIPSEFMKGQFDFLWSSCAFEHLGSIQHGLDFVLNSAACLKRGGVAVHTTEFNVSSDDDTIEKPGLSLFRRQDFLDLALRLESQGYSLVPIDYGRDEGILDGYIDVPPYCADPHLRLQCHEYVITSIGLVVLRNP